MNKIRICLSIGKFDKAFEKMIEELSPFAEVITVGLSDFSLAGVDIFIGKKLSVKILDTANRLKAVFAYKTGVDAFPLTHLAHKNVRVFNSHADSKIIAEYAFGLAVSLVNRISEFDRNLRQGIWYDTKNEFWQSIFSMKIGLVGYGYIGKDVHRILRNNGIAAYTLDRGKVYGDIGLAKDLDELIEICDLLILSLPKTPDTDNMFNANNLSKMHGKFIVNVGRSNAIDQSALFQALKRGTLAGAAIDTWDEKPKHKKDRLKPSVYDFETLPNVILSPHAAMRVANGHQNYVEDVTKNVIGYLCGEEPINEIDLKAGY